MPTSTPVPERLIAASDEPAGDWRALDWDAPEVPGAPWVPWEQVSLFDTPLWDALTADQRRTLSRHELASSLATGIWAENVLMQMLLRVTARQDPREARARYALVEIADECRHSLMFARLATRLDVPRYGPSRANRRRTAIFASIAAPAEVYATALVVEEVLDSFQRAALRDPDVQPLTNAVNRIHVVEESRHIAFARDELGARWPKLPRIAREAYAMTIAAGALVTTASLVDPAVYAAVGLEPRAAAAAVRRSSHRRALLTDAARGMVADFTELGVITQRSRPIWRRAGLL